jgi:hypothetical protein
MSKHFIDTVSSAAPTPSGSRWVLLPDEEKKAPTTSVTGASLAVDSGLEIPVTPPPSSILTAKSILSTVIRGNRSFRFKMSRSATLTSSGAGALALTTLFTPSGFDQYTQLSAFFEQVRLVGYKISYNSLVNPSDTTQVNTAVAIAFDPAAITGAVTSYTLCSRLPKVKTFSLLSTSMWPIVYERKVERNRPWSLITANPGGTDPVGGIAGGHCIAVASAVKASTAVLAYLIEAVFEFRNPY